MTAVRGRGLWAGRRRRSRARDGRALSEALLARGVLVKDTHGSTIRLAPPLMITKDDLDWSLGRLRLALGI